MSKGVNRMKDFITFVKKYSTRDFIYLLSRISIEIYKKQLNHDDDEMNCCMKFPLDIMEFGFIPKQVSVMLSAWDIQDMAYLSIRHSNDFRNGNLSSQDVGTIVNLYRGHENEHSNSEFLKDAALSEIFKFIMGMTYEQFKYQNLAWPIQNFCRNYHILIGSSNINREKIIDINQITNELLGLNVDELLAVEIMILWLCSKNPDPLSAPETLYHRTETSVITKETLERVVAYYSITYEEVWNSPIGKQIFYSKPFVITKKSQESIMVSFYLLVMTFADGLYWLVRDYYRNNNLGQRFINAFGEMFEGYFEELASIYLDKKQWFKIPEQKKKSADYYVEFDDVILLFELKSGLLGIGAKQQVPDIQQIDTFYKRNILEAYEQLKNSEEEYCGEKPILKIFLLYESATNMQIIMSSIPDIFVKDKGCYIMTIEDLEMLLATYQNDRENFKKVIHKLIRNENTEGKFESVLNVLNEYGATGDMHFIDERDYFANILKRFGKDFR